MNHVFKTQTSVTFKYKKSFNLIIRKVVIELEPIAFQNIWPHKILYSKMVFRNIILVRKINYITLSRG